MSDQEALTPKVIICRHGETEWAKSGRYTSFTDIELTPAGLAQVSSAANTLVGRGRTLDPERLAHIFVSPRVRAVTTFRTLLPGFVSDAGVEKAEVTYTEDITEWNYGAYEGLMEGEIRGLRKERGMDGEREWSIWKDGCEGGESSQQVAERLDRLVEQIKEIQEPCMGGEKAADVLIVAHGLILRCFVKRWLGLPIDFPLQMIFAPGAIAALSYKKNNVNEPAFHLGLAI